MDEIRPPFVLTVVPRIKKEKEAGGKRGVGRGRGGGERVTIYIKNSNVQETELITETKKIILNKP